MHINKIHKIDGVNFSKPLDIFDKLFEVIPQKIHKAKNKYPNIGFINCSILLKKLYQIS